MKVSVTRDNVIIEEGSNKPHENEYNITHCYFTYDDFINSFQVKRAIFTVLSTEEMYETDIINEECEIPIEVLKHEYESVKLGVYGYNIGENEELVNRFSPSYDTFVVPTGSYQEGALSPEPITPSQYDLYSQALQKGLQEVDDKVDEVIETVDSKIVEIDEAIARTNNLDLDADKVGKITSITITKKDGTQKEVTLEDGMGLDYVWRGTFLGIKREDETEYQYVDLQGPRGEPGAIHLVIVETLPQTGQEDTMYLVPLEEPESEENRFAEYIWVNNKWELLGKIGIEIDLSNYYTKQEVDSRIPTSLSQLSSDSTHRTVSDTEKSTWNNKLDSSALANYVQNTDYATTSSAGLVKASSNYRFYVNADGSTRTVGLSYSDYLLMADNAFVGKGTLENVIVGKDLTTKAYVDGLVGDIATTLDTINREVI